MEFGRVLGILGALTMLAGCSELYWTSNVRETMSLHSGQAIATNADVRLVHRISGYDPDTKWGTDGRPSRPPRDFLCAEPSPDVARVVQAALTSSASGAATVTPPAGGTAVDAQAAFNISASRAEGVAQLTKRIATIQLLRDGLYRACEAYANGALGQEGYTAILSRYDRMMITMLLGEMAAGNFGSAALLTGGSTAGPAAGAQEAADKRVATAQAARDQAQSSLDAERAKLPALRTEVGNKQQALQAAQASGASTTQAQADLAAANKNLQDQEQQVSQHQDALNGAVRDLKTAQLAQRAVAGTTSASSEGRIEQTSPQAQVASTLARMQRTYLNEPQGHALMLMCFTEMAKPESVRRDMRETCERLYTAAFGQAAQGLAWDTTARQQLRELDNDRIRALAAKLSPTEAAAMLKTLAARPDEPTGLPPRPRQMPQ